MSLFVVHFGPESWISSVNLHSSHGVVTARLVSFLNLDDSLQEPLLLPSSILTKFST